MFCHNCGSQLPQNTLFCGRCGIAIAVSTQPLAMQPVQTQPQPIPNSYEDKKEIYAALLVLLLIGVIGTLVLPIAAPIAVACAIISFVIALRYEKTVRTTAALVMSIIGIVIAAIQIGFLIILMI